MLLVLMGRYLRSCERTGQLLKSFLTRINWCRKVQTITDPSKFQVMAFSVSVIKVHTPEHAVEEEGGLNVKTNKTKAKSNKEAKI